MTTALAEPAQAKTGSPRLGLLLAMAMFVLVVDTSLMNVSISAVVKDLGTTVSCVQSAIALEALVSAAFILISSKIGDLIGRKRAYILGLLGYAVGALAMVLAQTIVPVIIFWAILGGLGASLLLPAMQSLIHGNFEGAAQKRVYALVGASAAIAAAIGPLLGGFVTTFLSWRVGFALELVVISVVLAGIGLVRDVPYTGDRRLDGSARSCPSWGWAASCSGSSSGRRAARRSGILRRRRGRARAARRWLVRPQGAGQGHAARPGPVPLDDFRLGITGQMLQQVALGGAMIALPIFLQMVLEYNALQAGLSLAPLSLTMFAVALLAGRRLGNRRPADVIQVGFALLTIGVLVLLPIVPRADSGLWLAIPLMSRAPGSGCSCRSSTTTRSRRSPRNGSARRPGSTPPAARSGCRSGSRWRAASCSRRCRSRSRRRREASTVIPPGRAGAGRPGARGGRPAHEQHRSWRLLVGEPAEVQAEIIRINTEVAPDRAPDRPAGSAAVWPVRVRQLVPDGPAARRHALRVTRGPRPRLTSMTSRPGDRISTPDRRRRRSRCRRPGSSAITATGGPGALGRCGAGLRTGGFA